MSRKNHKHEKPQGHKTPSRKALYEAMEFSTKREAPAMRVGESLEAYIIRKQSHYRKRVA